MLKFKPLLELPDVGMKISLSFTADIIINIDAPGKNVEKSEKEL
jgi:hypothetical protein